MNKMIIEKTSIPEVLIITNKKFGDDRGWFSEVFRFSEFDKVVGGQYRFVQTNESFSLHNILRGIHYQNPNPQGKMVRVVSGEVFDVAVDLRKHSPTFKQWVGVMLSAQNGRQLWVPPGFGHGFYVTGEHAHFVYACTDYYSPQTEHCIAYDDPELDIKWPVISGKTPLVSVKDRQGKFLRNSCIF